MKHKVEIEYGGAKIEEGQLYLSRGNAQIGVLSNPSGNDDDWWLVCIEDGESFFTEPLTREKIEAELDDDFTPLLPGTKITIEVK